MQRDAPEQSSPEEVKTGTALIPGNTFKAKAVEYVVVDGLAMFEGDIVLGTVEEVRRINDQLVEELSREPAAATIITGDQFRWPNGKVPYQIDPALPDQSRVTDAIAHWESKTSFRFPKRKSEANFVTFRPATGCSSSVGMRGNEQFVNLASTCTKGNVTHEIGHAVGLWHEQSREDRDAFVTIHWTKIKPSHVSNFSQHIADGDDIGAYDYGSIMHYPRDAFSVDGSDTITPVKSGVQIGQRTALSAGDIAAANTLADKTTPKLVPPFPGRLLKYPPITTGPDVTIWQTQMNVLGYSLTVDGKYGKLSKAACVKLQQERGLKADGIVGPKTWEATFASP